MTNLLDAASVVAIVAGAIFFLAGTLGLLRFPDTFTRLHALTKADNLGLGLVVLGLLPQVDGVITGLKLVVVWLLVMLAGACASQMVARAARRGPEHEPAGPPQGRIPECAARRWSIDPVWRRATAVRRRERCSGAGRQRGGASMTDVLNFGLGALIVALATWAVLARDAFAAVVGFIAYGLLLTLVWVQLYGVDVALTEAAIGGGLTGALLIGAASRLRGTEAAARAERPQAFTRVVAAAGAAAVTATLALCVLTLPSPRRRSHRRPPPTSR